MLNEAFVQLRDNYLPLSEDDVKELARLTGEITVLTKHSNGKICMNTDDFIKYCKLMARESAREGFDLCVKILNSIEAKSKEGQQ